MYDCMASIDGKLDDYKTHIDNRLVKHKSKILVFASGSGLIGGFLAMLAKWGLFE
jgi:hypothetical protein